LVLVAVEILIDSTDGPPVDWKSAFEVASCIGLAGAVGSCGVTRGWAATTVSKLPCWVFQLVQPVTAGR
jgi:hypothetical protein